MWIYNKCSLRKVINIFIFCEKTLRCKFFDNLFSQSQFYYCYDRNKFIFDCPPGNNCTNFFKICEKGISAVCTRPRFKTTWSTIKTTVPTTLSTTSKSTSKSTSSTSKSTSLSSSSTTRTISSTTKSTSTQQTQSTVSTTTKATLFDPVVFCRDVATGFYPYPGDCTR